MPGIAPTIKAQRTFLPGLASFQRTAKTAWNAALDLVFPPYCTNCGKADTSWCSRCQRELETYPLQLLQRTIDPNLVVSSTGVHSGILRTAVHAFKYEGVVHLATPLAERMLAVLDTRSKVDALIPVPIHSERRRQRGYNQAELLAQAIMHQRGIPVLSDVLVRHKETMSQVNLTMSEREQNVSGAFTVNQTLKGKHALLIDDVVTTGATLSACAQALIAAGAAQVHALTTATASDLGAR